VGEIGAENWKSTRLHFQQTSTFGKPDGVLTYSGNAKHKQKALFHLVKSGLKRVSPLSTTFGPPWLLASRAKVDPNGNTVLADRFEAVKTSFPRQASTKFPDPPTPTTLRKLPADLRFLPRKAERYIEALCGEGVGGFFYVFKKKLIIATGGPFSRFFGSRKG
jgi:hypothetical protein